MFLVSDLLTFSFKWCIFIRFTYFCRKNFMSRFTHFFRRFFVTEKQTPQTFPLLECMPGPFGGSGGPMWGLGGLAKTKFSNFHMRPLLALRCHLLDLTSFKHYDFGFLGQNWGLVAEKRPFLAKIGYMQKWIFLKRISSNFFYIAPKLLSSTIINDDICLFLYPNYKNFHYKRFCDFCQKLTLTG